MTSFYVLDHCNLLLAKMFRPVIVGDQKIDCGCKVEEGEGAA